MEFNKLPEGCEGPQKRRTEFKDKKEKLYYDAKNLVEIAWKMSKELRREVDPITLAGRKDDDIEALREAVKFAYADKVLAESEKSDWEVVWPEEP